MDINYGSDQDFLKYPPQSDLVIICYISNENGSSCKSGVRNQSDIHHRRGSWYHAAIASQTKFIVTFGEPGLEVGPEHFKRPRHVKGPSFMQAGGIDNDCELRPASLLAHSGHVRRYDHLRPLRAIPG